MFTIQRRSDKPSERCPWLMHPFEPVARGDVLPKELTDVKDLKEYLFKRFGVGEYKITFLHGGLKGLNGLDMQTVMIYRDGTFRIPERLKKHI